MKELKAIHDNYVANGGFVGLMSRSTPFAVQNYTKETKSKGKKNASGRKC